MMDEEFKKPGFWLKGRKPGGKWYDDQCPLDTLIKWLARIGIIALGFGLGALSNWIHHDPNAWKYSQDEPIEMNCSRSGWGGDC
jgi:hypothetical protein